MYRQLVATEIVTPDKEFFLLLLTLKKLYYILYIWPLVICRRHVQKENGKIVIKNSSHIMGFIPPTEGFNPTQILRWPFQAFMKKRTLLLWLCIGSLSPRPVVPLSLRRAAVGVWRLEHIPWANTLIHLWGGGAVETRRPPALCVPSCVYLSPPVWTPRTPANATGPPSPKCGLVLVTETNEDRHSNVTKFSFRESITPSI